MELRVKGANISIRPMVFYYKNSPAIGEHKHTFDHLLYVKRGGLRIEKLDENHNVVRTVDKYATDDENSVLIVAGVMHRVSALMDNSAGDCVFAHRNPQGEVVQYYTGWPPAFS